MDQGSILRWCLRWVTFRRPAVPLSQPRPPKGTGFCAFLVAGWIGIVTAAGSAVCAVSSSTDRSSSDAYGHPTAYGCTTVNATTVNATVADATVINASTTNTSTTATAVRKGVS